MGVDIQSLFTLIPIVAQPELNLESDWYVWAIGGVLVAALVMISVVVWLFVFKRNEDKDFGGQFEQLEKTRQKDTPTERKSLSREQLSAKTVSSTADTVSNASDDAAPDLLRNRNSNERTVDAMDDQSVIEESAEEDPAD